MMQGMLAILMHTPWWVVVLLALVVGLGLQTLRPRRLPIARLLITPALFIAWGLASLLRQSVAAPVLIAVWSGAALGAAALAWVSTRLRHVEIDRARRQVTLPGSFGPFLRNLLYFAAQYGLGVAVALNPPQPKPRSPSGTSPFRAPAPAISSAGSAASPRAIARPTADSLPCRRLLK